MPPPRSRAGASPSPPANPSGRPLLKRRLRWLAGATWRVLAVRITETLALDRLTLTGVPTAFPANGSLVRELPPRGHYYAAEVGQLAGVSGNMIGQWKRHGYIRASQQAADYPNVYSYQDVGEAMVIHQLILIEGISRTDIIAAIRAVRELYGYNWPLLHGGVRVADYTTATAGRPSVVVVDETGRPYDVARAEMWQQVVQSENIRSLALDLRRGGWAARELGNLKHIEVNPNRLSGRPAIRGTRVFAEHAATLGVSVDGQRTLRRDYGLNKEQISDAVRWYRQVQTYEVAA